jgi:predicted RNA binding protein YcfA (HicA-like mRNA interferase family)
MNIKITYGDLIKKLLTIDFEEKRIVGSHIMLINTKYNCTIVLPSFKKNKLAEQYIIMAVRKNLIEKGILNIDGFNALFNN